MQSCSRRWCASLCLGVVLCAAPGVWAQKATVLLTLRSGETIEGVVKSKKKSHVIFETWLGRRRVPAATIVSRRDAASLRERYRSELKKRQNRTISDRVSLARWCLARGFTSGLAAELDGILRTDPDNEFAWALIRRFAPIYRLARTNHHPKDKPRWARREVDLLYAAARNQSFLGAAMIRQQLDSLPDELQLNQAVKFARRGTEPQRWIAAYMLGQSNKVRRVKPLYRRALADPSWQVRQEAVASLRRHDDGTTIGPFVKALLKGERATTRTYAAEALGLLGDKRAVGPLMAALRATSGVASPRNHIRVTTQHAYVKDFDVEVAQSAFIADPVVDIVEDGVVLDVRVVSVSAQRSRISASLRSLTGVGKGFSVKNWSDWWKASKSRFPTRLR